VSTAFSLLGLLPGGAAPAGLGAVLLAAFLLGALHGLTPDEHTWPITFSYAVGSYSAEGGLRAGVLFSAAFTLQQALACELAYFAALTVVHYPYWNFYVYVLVGLVMLGSGAYVLRHGHPLRLSAAGTAARFAPRAMPSYMPLVHGFIAGWGIGAFTLLLYTVLVPATGSAYLAFLPGLLFGLGTMVMQGLLGMAFGAWMAHRRLGSEARTYVARRVAGTTLEGGGAAFLGIGLCGLLLAAMHHWHISAAETSRAIRLLDAGSSVAVMTVILLLAAYAFIRGLREARRHFAC
jgi:hypothetical protein